MEVAESPASERTPKGVTNIHILMKYLQETTSPAVTLYLIQSMREESMSNLDLYIPQLCYLVVTKSLDKSTKDTE